MASSVNLGDRLESAVADLVNAGRYGSRSEVLREGVRLVQERELRLGLLKAELRKGVEDIRGGRASSLSDVFAEVDARIDHADQKRAARKPA
jgi:antitoxin ParD1/3/4